MKKIASIFILITFFACNNIPNQNLQLQIDSIKSKVNNAYKPGLGEFMSSIQVHHEKLWFAGIVQNWRLADFEIHEIMESIDDIKMYASDRPETKDLVMMQPVIDSLNNSIEQKDVDAFKRNFIMLTTTCNNCHTEVNYDFNKIKVPDTPPFSNQVFKIDSVK